MQVRLATLPFAERLPDGNAMPRSVSCELSVTVVRDVGIADREKSGVCCVLETLDGHPDDIFGNVRIRFLRPRRPDEFTATHLFPLSPRVAGMACTRYGRTAGILADGVVRFRQLG